MVLGNSNQRPLAPFWILSRLKSNQNKFDGINSMADVGSSWGGGERRAGDYESILKGYWSITEASIDARRNCAECSTLCGTAPLPPCHVTGAHRKIKSNVANKQKSFWCDPAGTILQDRSLPPLRIPADDPGKNPEEEKKKVTNKPKSLRRDPAGAILQDRPLWGSRRIIFERIQKYH